MKKYLKPEQFISKKYRKKLKQGRAFLKRSYAVRDKLAKEWSSGKILELGCGEYPLFKNSTKVDIAKIDGCIQADCNRPLPLKDKFDTIIALELIEHLWNVDNFLKECNRLLRLNGKLIISTINVDYWKNRLKRLHGDYSDTKPCYFSPKSLKGKVSEYGFIVEVMKPLGRVRLLSLCGGFIIKCRKIERCVK